MNSDTVQCRETNERKTSEGEGTAVLEARSLHRYYRSGESTLKVLRGVDMTIGRGEVVSIVGPSGSGKSTLLHLLGGLDKPTKGEVIVDSRPLDGIGEDERALLRNRCVGFVFQFHHLLRDFSALENVMMPLLIRRRPVREARERAEHLLAAVGLAERIHHKPIELSGGEQQRTAVARSLAGSPLVILADEPTGNLDRETSEELHDMLFRISDEENTSFVVVTHNETLARRADRSFRLFDGRLLPEPVSQRR
jgi:lipoprotein-releasing system ATP-binding protein